MIIENFYHVYNKQITKSENIQLSFPLMSKPNDSEYTEKEVVTLFDSAFKEYNDGMHSNTFKIQNIQIIPYITRSAIGIKIAPYYCECDISRIDGNHIISNRKVLYNMINIYVLTVSQDFVSGTIVKNLDDKRIINKLTATTYDMMITFSSKNVDSITQIMLTSFYKYVSEEMRNLDPHFKFVMEANKINDTTCQLSLSLVYDE